MLAVFYFAGCSSKDPCAGTKPCEGDSCGRQVCKNYDSIPLEGVIDGATLHDMSVAYAADPRKGYVSKPGQESIWDTTQRDALSVVFTLEQLKNFISKMEQASCRAGCDSSTELAIRFYMIKYPSNLGSPTASVPECLKDLSATCASKHSLALVPAFKKAGVFYDFSLTNFSKDCFSIPMPTGNLSSIKMAAMTSTPEPGSAENHGGLGPPPAPGTYPTVDY